MINWTGTLLMTGFGLLMVCLFYTVGHMLLNRFRGRDELDGLFRFKRNNKRS